MKKKKGFYKVLGLFFSLLLFFPYLSYGFSYLDGQLTVDGYVQNQTSLRTTNNDFVSSEYRLHLEIDYSPWENVSFYGIWRSMYESLYDIGNWKDKYDNSHDALKWENEFREIYADVNIGDLSLRIGKQQIVWGETDGMRLMDIINPLDYRRQYFSRDWEDIRIPLYAVKGLYQINMERNIFIEGVWVPANVETNKMYLDDGTIERHQSPWRVDQILPDLLANTPGFVQTELTDDRKANTINNSEFGARICGEIGGYFMTVNFFHSFTDDPTLLMGTPFRRGLKLIIPQTLKYYSQRTIGFTFNKAVGLWVFRGEFAYLPDKPYQVWALNDLDYQLSNMDFVDRKDTLQYMIGFDYKQWYPFLNREKMFFISGQFFHLHIFDHKDGLAFGPNLQEAHEDTFYTSLMINTGYDKERICPEILAVYDITTSCWYVKPRVTFKYGNHWRPEIGGVIFEGGESELPFGVADSKDEVYCMIRYQF